MKHLERLFQPDGWQFGSFTGEKGKNIRYGHVEPAGEKRGTVVMTTGYADFMESHYETIHEYRDRGYAVWIMDWAGQGGSDKKTSDDDASTDIEDHLRDLHRFRNGVVRADEKNPVLMSTHSMGGQIGLQYLRRHPHDFDFAIMAAPLVDVKRGGPSSGVLSSIFRAAISMGKRDKIIKGARKSITHQLNVTRRMLNEEDPVRMNLHKTFLMLNRNLRAEDPTFGMIDSLFRSAEELNKETALKEIKTPVLFGIASQDDMVDNDSIRRAARVLEKADYVVIEGASHGLWLERDEKRAAWWKGIDVFLKEQHRNFDKEPRPPQGPKIAPPGGPQ